MASISQSDVPVKPPSERHRCEMRARPKGMRPCRPAGVGQAHLGLGGGHTPSTALLINSRTRAHFARQTEHEHGSKPASPSASALCHARLSLRWLSRWRGRYAARKGGYPQFQSSSVGGSPPMSGEVFTQWHCRWWIA